MPVTYALSQKGNIRIALLIALLIGQVYSFCQQSDSFFTYEDPNCMFSEGGPCLEVGTNDSENHFFLATAFDYSFEWFTYEQEHDTPAKILKLSPEMELLGEMVVGEEGRRSTVTSIHPDPENKALFIAVGKIHDNELHYDRPFMVRFDGDLNVVWQKEVDLPDCFRKFFFWPRSFMDSQNDIVYMTEVYGSDNMLRHPYLYLRFSTECDVLAIDSTATTLFDKGGIFEYNDGSGDYGVCNSFTSSVQRLNRNFDSIGQRKVPNNIVFDESNLEILFLRRFDVSTILPLPDSTLFVAVDGDSWKYPDVVADAVLMKLSPADTMLVVHAQSFDGLFFSGCYNDTSETVAAIKGLDKSGDHLFLCYCIMNYEPGGGMVGNSSFCVTKLTLGLDVVWQRVYGFNKKIMPRYVMATQDGGCLVTGEIGTGLDGLEGTMMFAAKIDSEGYLVIPEKRIKGQPLSYYPNPVKNRLHIQVSPDIKPDYVELYDLQGRLVRTQRNGLESLSLQGLAAGQYVMKVIMENGQTFSDKVVKE